MLIEIRDVENIEDPLFTGAGLTFRARASDGATLLVGYDPERVYVGQVGDRFSSIVGLVTVDAAGYLLQPRFPEDLTFEGGEHPPR